MFCLKELTPQEWIACAVRHVDAVLIDHAHCEQKAAVTALSFVSKYPDDNELVSRLAALAEEEAGHFREMVNLCLERGLKLGHPGADPYVKALLAHTRPHGWMHREDRLLICALIEARSCERLKLLAEHLEEEQLRETYAAFWKAEVQHFKLFVDLASRTRQHALHIEPAQAEAETKLRLDALAEEEARIMSAQPIRPAIH